MKIFYLKVMAYGIGMVVTCYLTLKRYLSLGAIPRLTFSKNNELSDPT